MSNRSLVRRHGFHIISTCLELYLLLILFQESERSFEQNPRVATKADDKTRGQLYLLPCLVRNGVITNGNDKSAVRVAVADNAFVMGVASVATAVAVLPFLQADRLTASAI